MLKLNIPTPKGTSLRDSAFFEPLCVKIRKRVWSLSMPQKKNEKALRETQTLRADCSKAEQQIFAPPQTAFPEAQEGQNLISWRWFLPSPTDPVWWRSMHAVSNYRGNRLTNKHTNPQTNKQTGPITIHCTAKLNAQCNKDINSQKTLYCTHLPWSPLKFGSWGRPADIIKRAKLSGISIL